MCYVMKIVVTITYSILDPKRQSLNPQSEPKSTTGTSLMNWRTLESEIHLLPLYYGMGVTKVSSLLSEKLRTHRSMYSVTFSIHHLDSKFRSVRPRAQVRELVTGFDRVSQKSFWCYSLNRDEDSKDWFLR